MTNTASHSRVEVRLDSLDGHSRVTLRNQWLAAEFLPEIGGKMISLKRNESGHEFLLQPPSGKSYRRSRWGTPFEESDTSGFDECVPTVSACRYPHAPFAGQPLPDHGELWSAEWEHELDGHALLLKAKGLRLPYEFSKRIALQNSDLTLRYEFNNRGEFPLKYLWSSHPLLAAEAGAQVILPPSVSDVYLHSSRHNRLGKTGSRISWPGNGIGKVEGPHLGSADKLFATGLKDGCCAFYKPQADESITFRFDPALVPHVGIWMSQGGWPEPGPGHFTVALEPCNGYPDSLEEAVARGACATLAGGATHTWDLRVQLHKGPPQFNPAMEITS
jgi:hypothetical protein